LLRSIALQTLDGTEDFLSGYPYSFGLKPHTRVASPDSLRFQLNVMLTMAFKPMNTSSETRGQPYHCGGAGNPGHNGRQ
jgi:hypothetical protein